MTIRQHRYVFIVATSVVVSCAGPEPAEEPLGRDLASAERSLLAASGHYLVLPSMEVAPVSLITTVEVSGALDIPASMAPTLLSLTDPDPTGGEAMKVRGRFGTVLPRKGASFLVMGTGRSAGNDVEQAEPGLDFVPFGPDGDIATIRFRVNVPPGASRLSFDYSFLSAEAPEYVNTSYNDKFTAKVADTLGERVIETVSVNSATFHPASETAVGTYGFVLYADNPFGVDDVFTGSKLDAGTTGWQHVNVPIAPGTQASNPVIIEFDVRDVGDGLLDSMVILDNLNFSGIEKVDPNIARLLDADGRIYRDSQMIHDRGKNVHSVVADGVTQLLLRSQVPAAGRATFSLSAAGFPTKGRLSANQDVLSWGSTVTVDTVQVGTAHYAFALYQSPEDFNDPDDPADDAVTMRTVDLTLSFTPTSGPAAPLQAASINIVRPPVLIVPDMLSKCENWSSEVGVAIAQPPADSDDLRGALKITCAEYERSSWQGFAANENVIADYIWEALNPLRIEGIAGTQVDVIGHGVGGLLVRKYIDSDNYLRRDNFKEGNINRVITMHTPHLGSRMADEIVRFRDFFRTDATAQEWGDMQSTFDKVGIRIDSLLGDRMFDELGSESPEINSIGKNVTGARNVPFHVISSTRGRSITRDEVDRLNLKLMPLFVYMEWHHPLAKLLPDDDKERLIFGSNSFIFCSDPPDPLPDPPPPDTTRDDHDLLLTMWEQQGGITAATPPFLTTGGVDDYSHHEAVSNEVNHTFRLMELLNTPVSDPTYTTAIRPPAEVERVNHCPILLPLQAPSLPMQHQRSSLGAPGTITLSLTPSGPTVAPGTDVTATVQTSGAVPSVVMILGPGSTSVDKVAPFQTVVKVPSSAIGTVSFRAVAFYSQGGTATAVPIDLEVQIPASLTSMEVLNGDVFLQRPGKTRQLTILGDYSDGIKRDITSAQGTTYTISSWPPDQVATASVGGLVTAIGSGDATITIRNGTVVTSVNLNVSKNDLPVAVCQSPTVCNDAGTCSADVTNLGAGSSDPDGDPLSITQSPAGPYAVGQHTVSVSVSDGSPAAQCTSQLEVLDCEEPTLTCPADFVAECTAAGGAQITPPPASATDNCSVTLNSPAPGHLPLGTSQLTYTASDPAGNGASCTTVVTVQDTTAPSITCPASTVAECTGDGQAVIDLAATATDSCTAVSINDPGPTSYPLGTTPVIFTAHDGAGNQSSCSTSVTVQDMMAPSITCPSPIVAECVGPSGAFVIPGQATSSDVCTGVTVVGPSSAFYPLGTTFVTYTSRDAIGNQSSCTSAIQVVDTLPPQVSVTAPAPLWPANGQYRTISLADCNITIEDSCSGPLPPNTYQSEITCVTSDEPDNATGPHDGNTDNDIVIVDGTTVRLRAERHVKGDGRVYNIHFRVRDNMNNTKDGVCSVTVPHHPSAPASDGVVVNSVCH